MLHLKFSGEGDQHIEIVTKSSDVTHNFENLEFDFISGYQIENYFAFFLHYSLW